MINPQNTVDTTVPAHDTQADIDAFTQDMKRFAGARMSRRDVRSLVFHLLYMAEAHSYEESLETIAYNMRNILNVQLFPHSEAFCTAKAIIEQREALDAMYVSFLTNWRIERISVVVKLIMRLACWEFVNTTVDRKIIINEAIELSKDFAESDGYKFINGILDRLAQKYPVVRAQETSDSAE